MIYLTLTEIDSYSSISGITQQIINQACGLIDTFVGDISKKQKVEQSVLNKKSTGKLSKVKPNVPLVSIDSLRGIYRTPFGTSYETLVTTDLFVDEQGYYKYTPAIGLNTLIYGVFPSTLEITYTYGYEDAPEDLKIACALICQNLARRGSFGAKSIQDFDVSLTFLDDSIITSDIRSILMRYRGV